MALIRILTGDHELGIRARRSELLAGSKATPDAVARYDLTDESEAAAFTTALATIPMFGGPRYLEASPLELLDPAAAALITKAGIEDTIVLYGRTAVKADVLTATGATVEAFKLPTGAGVTTMVTTLAQAHDLTLSTEVVAHIAERCANDIGRLQSVIYSLAITSQRDPSIAVVDRYLVGTTTAAGTPWALTDQLAQGRIGAALAIADTVEPLAALSFVSVRLGQVGRIVEDGSTSGEQAASAVGLASVPVARNLIVLGQRLGQAGLAASWTVVARADIALKTSSNPRASLEAALVELHQLWSAPVPLAR
jgi:DNA polymerase III delta subunit